MNAVLSMFLGTTAQVLGLCVETQNLLH